jgi:hypothetical protein
MATARTAGGSGRYTAPAPKADDVVDFDSEEYRGKSTVRFKLGGRTWHVRANVPWNLMGVPESSTEDIENVQRALKGLESGKRDIEAELSVVRGTYVHYRDFFASVLVEEEVDPFFAMIDGPKTPLHSGNLKPIIDHVMAKIGEPHPTKRPASSGRGSRSTQKSSAASSSSRGTARRRSAS